MKTNEFARRTSEGCITTSEEKIVQAIFVVWCFYFIRIDIFSHWPTHFKDWKPFVSLLWRRDNSFGRLGNSDIQIRGFLMWTLLFQRWGLQFFFLHILFRVCYTFGKRIKFQIQDITPTFLSPGVISTLKQADHVAYSVILKHGKELLLSSLTWGGERH